MWIKKEKDDEIAYKNQKEEGGKVGNRKRMKLCMKKIKGREKEKKKKRNKCI